MSSRSLAARVAAYSLVGLVSTAVVSAVFFVALGFVNYLVANAAAWLAGLVVGFTLNRRFTFGIRGGRGRGRHASLYFAGTVLQFGLSQLCLYLLIGRLGSPPVPAWACALVATTLFGFAFANLVTFRRAPTP